MQAVLKAERFIELNGYTDLAAYRDRRRLSAEHVEWESGLNKRLKYRHNQLWRRACAYTEGRRRGPGWTIAFRYRNPASDSRNTGRAVTMNPDGSGLLMEHVDILLDHLKPLNPRPRPKSEQIKAILSGDLMRWALGQLFPGQTLEDAKYGDFLEVTPAEILAFVEKYGFPKRIASANSSHFVIEESGKTWKVVLLNPQGALETIPFGSLKEARLKIIRLSICQAKSQLNARYRAVHPDLHLPPATEME